MHRRRVTRALEIAAALVLTAACKQQAAPVGSLPYANDFEATALGPEWFASGGHWTIDRGALYTTGANNAPLFLAVDLPADVVVEVDVLSETSAVDSKVELMTDGRTHQSGYVFIAGGWNNAKSIIARRDEHGVPGKDVVSKQPTDLVANRRYHWRIEKKGDDIRWLIDGAPYLAFSDPEPLFGPGNNRFAFNNWQNRIRFDNLRIWPHASAPAMPRPDAMPSRATTSTGSSN